MVVVATGRWLFQRVICEHVISNILCACQDGDNPNCFAYTRKALMSDKHYCHVFNVKSSESSPASPTTRWSTDIAATSLRVYVDR